MTCTNSERIGSIDFERLAFYARKRFIEGIDTLILMTQTHDEEEKREIARAAWLDLDDARHRERKLFSCDNDNCKASSYRRQLQQMFAGCYTYPMTCRSASFPTYLPRQS